MKDTFPAVQEQLLEFSVVGPGATLVYDHITIPRSRKIAIAGPRRALNWIANRRWFDNEEDTSPACEEMYKDELRRFRAYMVKRVDSEDLRNLNLLGVQFALCECSKHHP